MALFPLRRPRNEKSVPAAPAQTVEALRRRALHRLIGAAVLVLAGVIGFPLVFDNQPRPIPVDLPIEIADKDKARPLVAPPVTPEPVAQKSAEVAPAKPEATPAATAEAARPAAEAAPKPPAATAMIIEKAEKPPAPSAPAPKAEAPNPPAPKVAIATVPPADASAKTSDAQKAKALLEGKSPVAASDAAAERFVVQVGAFADNDKLREVRRKLERAGLKTYTQEVQTKDGPRTRVRIGPFEDKTRAQQAADKIRKLDLSPSVLTL